MKISLDLANQVCRNTKPDPGLWSAPDGFFRSQAGASISSETISPYSHRNERNQIRIPTLPSQHLRVWRHRPKLTLPARSQRQNSKSSQNSWGRSMSRGKKFSFLVMCGQNQIKTIFTGPEVTLNHIVTPRKRALSGHPWSW